jgi:hypothetical protein
MEQTAIFSPRIRWVAIATGVASGLALFPILFFLYPGLLIAGGYIQPRFPTIGKWFVWVGAASLWVDVIVYDEMMFQDLRGQTKSPEYMVLTFSATTVLLTWCSVELIADGLKRIRAHRSMPPAEPRPVSWGVWSFAVVLNLFLGWVAANWVLAPSQYRHATSLYTLTMALLQALPVVALDISLIRTVVKLRRAPRANLDGME